MQPGASHTRLQNSIGGKAIWIYFSSTKYFDTSGKNAPSMHSFISPMPPACPNYSSHLFATLGRLMPFHFRRKHTHDNRF